MTCPKKKTRRKKPTETQATSGAKYVAVKNEIINKTETPSVSASHPTEFSGSIVTIDSDEFSNGTGRSSLTALTRNVPRESALNMHKSVTSKSVMSKSAPDKAVTAESVTAELRMDESVMGESVMGESVMDASVMGESVMDESVMDDSVMDDSVMGASVMDESVMGASVMDESVMGASIMSASVIHDELPPLPLFLEKSLARSGVESFEEIETIYTGEQSATVEVETRISLLSSDHRVDDAAQDSPKDYTLPCCGGMNGFKNNAGVSDASGDFNMENKIIVTDNKSTNPVDAKFEKRDEDEECVEKTAFNKDVNNARRNDQNNASRDESGDYMSKKVSCLKIGVEDLFPGFARYIGIDTGMNTKKKKTKISRSGPCYKKYMLALQEEEAGNLLNATKIHQEILTLSLGENYEFEKSKNPKVDVNAAASYNRLGVINEKKYRYGVSLECYSEALRMYKQLKVQEQVSNEGTEIENDLFNEELSLTFYNIGQTHRHLGEHNKAIKASQEALKIQLDLLEDQEENIASTMYNMALVYSSQNVYDTALKLFFNVLDIQHISFGKDHLDVASTLESIGVVYEKRGASNDGVPQDHMDALKYYNKALETRRAAVGEHHLFVAMTLFGIGRFHLARWKRRLRNDERIHAEEAMSCFEEAMLCYEKNGMRNDHPTVSKLESYMELLQSHRDSNNCINRNATKMEREHFRYLESCIKRDV